MIYDVAELTDQGDGRNHVLLPDVFTHRPPAQPGVHLHTRPLREVRLQVQLHSRELSAEVGQRGRDGGVVATVQPPRHIVRLLVESQRVVVTARQHGQRGAQVGHGQHQVFVVLAVGNAALEGQRVRQGLHRRGALPGVRQHAAVVGQARRQH